MAEHLYADTVVIGGGTAGAAVAARLAQGGSQSVMLVKSGPDYGAFAEGRWPAPLLDARSLPGGHDWGYINGASAGVQTPAGACPRHRRLFLAQWLRHDMGQPGRLRWLGRAGKRGLERR